MLDLPVMWRKWLIDVPATLFDLWWAAYRLVLMAAIMVSVTVLALMLSLRLFGIRWGW